MPKLTACSFQLAELGTEFAARLTVVARVPGGRMSCAVGGSELSDACEWQWDRVALVQVLVIVSSSPATLSKSTSCSRSAAVSG